MKTKSKYNARKTAVYGITFDSKREAERFLDLSAQQKRGEIRDLRLQVEFPLILAHKDAKTGKRVPSTIYRADFTYERRVSVDGAEGWVKIVEDVKGYKTSEYILKKKLMKERWGVEVLET